MNNILSDEAQSFRILRPKLRSGSYKPYLGRLKRNDNVAYLNLSLDPNEIFVGLKNL